MREEGVHHASGAQLKLKCFESAACTGNRREASETCASPPRSAAPPSPGRSRAAGAGRGDGENGARTARFQMKNALLAGETGAKGEGTRKCARLPDDVAGRRLAAGPRPPSASRLASPPEPIGRRWRSSFFARSPFCAAFSSAPRSGENKKTVGGRRRRRGPAPFYRAARV